MEHGFAAEVIACRVERERHIRRQRGRDRGARRGGGYVEGPSAGRPADPAPRAAEVWSEGVCNTLGIPHLITHQNMS
jgi:hypothetical protein